MDIGSPFGFKIENGLVFGTDEWFTAVENEKIGKYIIKGVISRISNSGHDDFPEFEINNNNIKTVWIRKGLHEAYKVGKNVELVYVEQKYKRPTDITGPIAKCIVQIKIS